MWRIISQLPARTYLRTLHPGYLTEHRVRLYLPEVDFALRGTALEFGSLSFLTVYPFRPSA